MTTQSITMLQLFQGYDSFKSEGRETAVQGTQNSSNANAQSYFQVCTDVESVRSALNISASVSASFGFGSVDAKTTFMHSLAITSTSVTIIVYTNIIEEILSGGTDAKLIGAPPSNLQQFFAVYGDSFVSSLTLGSEYYAAYVFRSESIEEQQNVTAKLSANGIGLSGSLSANFAMQLSTARSSLTTNCEMRQNMSGVKNPVFPDQDHMIQFALNFGSVERDAPVILDYEVTGYERVPQMLPSFQPIVDTRALFQGTPDRPGLADQYAALATAANGAARIKQVYQRYGFTEDTQLDSRLNDINADKATLDGLFDKIDGDPSQTWTAPPLASLGYGMPSLHVVVTPGPQPGGSGGSTFDDIDATTVSSANALEKLYFQYHDHVHELFCTYAMPDGTSKDSKYGWDSNGTASNTLVLQPGEYISQVSVVAVEHVHQVQVWTTFGSSIIAPPQLILPGPTTVVFSADSEHRFVGFAGSVDSSTGIFLRLGVVYANFSPADWSGAVARLTPVRTARQRRPARVAQAQPATA